MELSVWNTVEGGAIGSWINDGSRNSIGLHRETSSSTLSFCSSTATTSFVLKSLKLNLPENYGAHITSDGRIHKLFHKSPAHISGVVQVGDYVKILDGDNQWSDGTIVFKLTYAVLKVRHRPKFPFQVEIGNPSNTALGIALSDPEYEEDGSGVRICSIQPGSLGERCGFLYPGDILTSVQNEQGEDVQVISSRQGAELIRKLIPNLKTIKLNIQPVAGVENTAGRERSGNEHRKSAIGSRICDDESAYADRHANTLPKLLCFCLWKDSSFDDWGFSLVDSNNTELENGPTSPTVNEIRPGGPAYLAGLQTGDKILNINERDVSIYESTILVPILASLGETLNLVVLRYN